MRVVMRLRGTQVISKWRLEVRSTPLLALLWLNRVAQARGWVLPWIWFLVARLTRLWLVVV